MANEELIADAREMRDGGIMLSTPGEHFEMIERLADALEAATVESEWEYALRDPGADEPFTDVYRDMETLSDCESSIVWGAEELVRRRKAGEWEPVGGDDA